MSINKVIENGFCVGCGACKAILKDKVSITMQENGFYRANILDKISLKELTNTNSICPFSSESQNEDALGKHFFGQKKYNNKVGFYNNIYAGYINNKKEILNSSSGGLTTWFAEKLLSNNEVDAVIHVGQKGKIFEYRISINLSDLSAKKNKKSRYYPVTYEKLIDYILSTNDRIMFIGIPCFVKSIRLLQKELGLDNIKFVISLLCGHMKSADFSESLAWQVGVKPNNFQGIDFRVKKSGYKANNYFIEVTSENKKTLHRNSSLLGANWGHGFFKHKACDFCDDLAGELADVTFGDAWLPRYTNDYLGTNIVISRNSVFDRYLREYRDEVTIEEVSIEDFYNSQAGNYRHRRGGLKSRIENEKNWFPEKRMYLSDTYSSNERAKLYIYRHHLSKKSINNYNIAKRFKSILLFKILMLPGIIKYDYLNIGLIRTIKIRTKKLFIKVLKKLNIIK